MTFRIKNVWTNVLIKSFVGGCRKYTSYEKTTFVRH